MARLGLPEIILALQPEMKELLYLREEVQRLRFKQNPPTPTLVTLMADLPITVRQDDDGRWSAKIATGTDTPNTGTSGHETDVEAFRAAVKHACRLLGEAWSELDDD